MKKLESIASAEDNITTDHDTSAEGFIKNYKRMMSISEILPIKKYIHADPEINTSTGGFIIQEGTSDAGCEKIACLLVEYFGRGYEKTVIETIEDAGYEPTDYQIIYERYY